MTSRQGTAEFQSRSERDDEMAKKPNYDQERRERDRLKAAKKAEKQNAKAEKIERAKPEEAKEQEAK